MEKSSLEIVAIIAVGYLLYLKYKQTRIKEYVYSVGVLTLFYALFYVSGSKFFIYVCFPILAILFFRICRHPTNL